MKCGISFFLKVWGLFVLWCGFSVEFVSAMASQPETLGSLQSCAIAMPPRTVQQDFLRVPAKKHRKRSSAHHAHTLAQVVDADDGEQEEVEETQTQGANTVVSVSISKKMVSDKIKATLLSAQNQVIAAWVQLNLVGEAPYAIRKLEGAQWGLVRAEHKSRVSDIINDLKPFTQDKEFLFFLFELMYQRVDRDDRLVPGCGNDRRVLLAPGRLQSKIKSVPVVLLQADR